MLIPITDRAQAANALREVLAQAKHTVFFGGAGVSTESGIPDFRSADGIYRRESVIPPETILSRPFFDAHPEDFFAFYRETLLTPDAKPNAAHRALAKMEREGRLDAVVTQNIDGLHQAAGSKRVYELHGSVLRNRCMRCKRVFGVETVADPRASVPRCDCGGTVKPEVVLYGEPLEDETVTGAVNAIARADTLLVAGTSLRVYPAAGLLRYFGGTRLIVINYDATDWDGNATLCIRRPVGELLGDVEGV